MEEYEQAVFISYAWGDEREEIVDQLDQALAQRGLKIIRDKRDLPYKGSINKFMERIGQGNCVIVVISDKYLRSPNCMFELVEIADGEQFHDRIFPIVLNDADIYDPIKRLEYVKLWEDKLAKLDKAMREVGQANLQGIREEIDQYSRIRDKVSGLTSILKDMNTLTPEMHRESDFSQIYEGIMERGGIEPASISGEAPFKGLQYFDVEDSSLFFGRTKLTNSLLEHIKTNRFLAVVGASGSGKSSVVRAGVVASLQDQPNWNIHIVTPTSDPLETLALALTNDSESVTAAKTLREDMRNDPESLHLYARRLMTGDSKARMLLVVDQFEELFTLCKDLKERDAYVNNLMTAVSDEKQGPLTVVLTLRADFYPHCMQLQPLIDMPKYQINIGGMNQDELRQSIEEPAKQGGWEFEEGLVDLMLRDVSDEPGALPLLSHALLATWQRRRGRTLTLAGYSDAGGVHGAIAKTAEDTYRDLTSEKQQIARSIFLRLTELGERNQDTRRRVRLDELEQGSATVDDVLRVLADARLVTTGKDSVEVAHEALIREWPTLRLWLDEDREALRIHRHLTETANSWERNQHDVGDLYRGTRLAQVLEWATIHADEMSPLEKEYIKACQAEQRREQSVKQKLRILMSYVFFTNMILLGVTGWFGVPVILERIARFRARGEMIMILGGPTIIGTEDQTLVDAGYLPRMTIDLPAYQIGKYEVTNYQYGQCVEYSDCSVPLDQTEFKDVTKIDYPVVNVTLFQANMYCRWLGQRLPTQYEWERAARGTNGDDWPWGNEEPTPDRANMPLDDQILEGLLPANSLPQGTRDGVYNLVGNVWEWTPSYIANTNSFDPKLYWNGTPETYDNLRLYVLMGGSWEYAIDDIVISDVGLGSSAHEDLGFRCAADLK